jgi:hypothetical protein
MILNPKKKTRDEGVMFKGRNAKEIMRELKKCEVISDVYYIIVRRVSVTSNIVCCPHARTSSVFK